MEKEYLNINEVSEYLGIKKSTLYFHVENGDIPHYRIGRLIRFKKQDIGIWMEGNRKEKIDLHRQTLKILGKVANPNLDVESIVKKPLMKQKERGIFPSKRNQADSRASERRLKMGLFKRGQTWWMRFTYKGKQIRKSTETDDKKLAVRIYQKVMGEVAEGNGLRNCPGKKRPSGR